MSTTTTPQTEPRVWIGCLACYNAGRLTGNGWGIEAIAQQLGVTTQTIIRDRRELRDAA